MNTDYTFLSLSIVHRCLCPWIRSVSEKGAGTLWSGRVYICPGMSPAMAPSRSSTVAVSTHKFSICRVFSCFPTLIYKIRTLATHTFGVCRSCCGKQDEFNFSFFGGGSGRFGKTALEAFTQCFSHGVFFLF